MAMSTDKMVFPYPGVLIDKKSDQKVRGIRWALSTADGDSLKIKYSDGEVENFSITVLTRSPRTDTIIFVSDGNSYTIRRLRETDGLWLSPLGIDLPTDVLESIITKGDDQVADAALTAYATEDSPYIVGVVYSSDEGSFAREGGDWAHLAADDDTFTADGLLTINIDPDKAGDFLKLYDKNYVSVDDAEKYESASALPEEASEEAESETAQSDD